MKHALAAIALLVAVGALPALTDTLPAHCGAVGAASYTPPPYTVPAVVLNRGTVITVTNATVTVNGDTSSVAALVANPGADGISIEEAILATNNDPGTWNIQFAPALKGSSIVVDPVTPGPQGLAFLTGGNVTINGDIDGDGKPDITLTSLSGATTLFVLSGGNTLNGLALQNCGICVQIQRPSAKYNLPAATGTTFSNIAISNLVMTNIQTAGIRFSPDDTAPALLTGNTWDNIVITGNTITGSATGPALGIDVEVGVSGDTVQHTVIANNNILLPMTGAGGIAMNFGTGLGSANNQALDTLVANNAISGPLLQVGIRLATGVGSASGNLIDGVQMISNQILITSQPPGSAPRLLGIGVGSGDAASDDQYPSLRPIQYSENNIARNIGILSNSINLINGFAVAIQAACCGNSNNTIGNLSILGNTMTSNLQISGGSSGGYGSQPSAGNSLSNVVVQANSILNTTPAGNPNFTLDAAIQGAGIGVFAGSGGTGNSVNALSIANNDVNTNFIGISIAGGYGSPGLALSLPTVNNVVAAAQILCNVVDQAPTLGVTPSSGIKGINVAAGVDAASGNQIQQLSVYDNLVAGVLGDASLFANLESGAAGNAISIAQVSAAVNAPQFVPAGMLNAATFQQGAVVPGSLVSLFGANLSGATVQFDAFSAPILYSSSPQLNLQVPWEVQGQSSSQVTVTANSITSAPQTVAVGTAAPGIFSLGAPQGGQGAIANTAGMVVNASSPAHAGDYLQIYATGLGAVTNTPQTGAAAGANPLSYSISYPMATIGGVAAPVIFAGLAPGFVGLYQVDAQVPQGVAAGDSVPVSLSMGASVSNTVTISVR